MCRCITPEAPLTPSVPALHPQLRKKYGLSVGPPSRDRRAWRLLAHHHTDSAMDWTITVATFGHKAYQHTVVDDGDSDVPLQNVVALFLVGLPGDLAILAPCPLPIKPPVLSRASPELSRGHPTKLCGAAKVSPRFS